MGIKIIATPDTSVDALHGHGLDDKYRQLGNDAPSRGYTHVGGWTSVQELIAGIQRVLDAHPDDCLEVLDIDAHGNPWLCDGVNAATAVTLGTALKNVSQRLCDEVTVYLTGCNTAVRPGARTENLARILSRHTPTRATHERSVTVCGSVGYLSGSHVWGNERTGTETTVKKDYFAPYPDVTDASGTVHPGSRAESGDACWRCFREGVER